MQTVALYLCYIQYVCNDNFSELIRKISPTCKPGAFKTDLQAKMHLSYVYADMYLRNVWSVLFLPLWNSVEHCKLTWKHVTAEG